MAAEAANIPYSAVCYLGDVTRRENKTSTGDLAGRKGDTAPEPQPAVQSLQGVGTLHKQRNSGQVLGN